MKPYGWATHESKVESYDDYKAKKVTQVEGSIKSTIQTITDSSLTREDKKALLVQAVHIINLELYK